MKSGKSGMAAARDCGINVVNGGVYWQTKGPRFETKAEIRMMSQFADLVGMTMASEAVIAQELGLSYASLCSVDNYANGLGERELTVDEILQHARRNADCSVKNSHEIHGKEKMMKFSTRGDGGETSLLGGQRVPKYDPRPETYGVLDEASSALGVARAATNNQKIKEIILSVQKDLLIMGAELSSLPEDIQKLDAQDRGRRY